MRRILSYIILLLLCFSLAFGIIIDFVRVSEVPLVLEINVFNDGEPPVEITDFHFSVVPSTCQIVEASGPPGWTLRYALPNSFVEMDAPPDGGIMPGESGSFHITLEGPCEDAVYTFYLTGPEGVIPGTEREGPLGPLDVGEDNRPRKLEITISPNPFNSSVSISVPARAAIEIYDLSGKLIEEFDCGCRATTWVWQPDASLSSGVYLVRASLDEVILSERVVFLK